MGYLLAILGGYLLGCSNMALYLGKIRRVDIRNSGSGNLGASNAMVTMGWGAGVLTALHDIGKAFLAVIVAQMIFFPEVEHIGAVAGVSCVLGHIYPFYLKFRGGKGFASYVGMTLALNWKLAVGVILLAVIVTLVTDYIALATTSTILVVPAWVGFVEWNWPVMLILLVATAVMLLKHRENYARMRSGTEIGLRAANRGEHRVK